MSGKPKITNLSKRWTIQKVRVRIEGPATIFFDGNKYWFKKDVLHRNDAPASITPLGHKWWSDRGLSYKRIHVL